MQTSRLLPALALAAPTLAQSDLGLVALGLRVRRRTGTPGGRERPALDGQTEGETGGAADGLAVSARFFGLRSVSGVAGVTIIRGVTGYRV